MAYWRARCTYRRRGRYRGHLPGRCTSPRQARCRAHHLDQWKDPLRGRCITRLLGRYAFRLQGPCTCRHLARYTLRRPVRYTSRHLVRCIDLRPGRNTDLVAKCYRTFRASAFEAAQLLSLLLKPLHSISPTLLSSLSKNTSNIQHLPGLVNLYTTARSFIHPRLFMPPSSPWEDYNYKSSPKVTGCRSGGPAHC
jgi:hypothetical protein